MPTKTSKETLSTETSGTPTSLSTSPPVSTLSPPPTSPPDSVSTPLASPCEPHLNHPLFLNTLESIDAGARLIQCDPNVLERLKHPKKCLIVSVPIRMDNQSISVFQGYRVQYSSTLGPYKGGIRFHPNVDLGEVVGLACLMTIKNSVMGLPFGGGKGGICVDPSRMSRTELQNLTRRYTSEIQQFIGPTRDIPAPDIGTDAQTMAWMMDTYSQETGIAQLAVVTGKPPELGGSLGRAGATGLGCVYVAEKCYEKLGLKMKNSSIAIQGFGNVGSHAALYSWERGARIIAVSDSSGGFFLEEGFHIPTLIEYSMKHKSLSGLRDVYPQADVLTNAELLELKVDCLFPCALENQINVHNAEHIRARMIVEGANGPITAGATDILHRRGIFIAPDIIANGGGVVVSYFEWVQDIMSFFWDEEEVHRRLQTIITKAFDRAYQFSKEMNVNLRSAAMAVAIQRLEKANLLRGLYPR